MMIAGLGEAGRSHDGVRLRSARVDFGPVWHIYISGLTHQGAITSECAVTRNARPSCAPKNVLSCDG
jgi:hypothetical protein